MEAQGVEVQQNASSSEVIEKGRVQFLKIVLNIYRARRMSLCSYCKTQASDVAVPYDMRNYDYLREQILGIQDDLTFLNTFRSSIDIIHNSITCLTTNNIDNFNLRRQITRLFHEISYFSQSLMELYETNINEIENIRKKQEYANTLSNFKSKLDILKEGQERSVSTEEELRRLEKAENQVRKINFIREMKLILLGKFAGSQEDFPQLQDLRTSFRRVLTIEDFTDDWNVGL